MICQRGLQLIVFQWLFSKLLEVLICGNNIREKRCITKNYWPVCLLCVVSKILEQLLDHRFLDHLEICGSEFEYGFGASWSNADLLMFATNRIILDFNRSGVTRSGALDISKAFNRVWYTDLAHKVFGHFCLFSVTEIIYWFWMVILCKNIQLILDSSRLHSWSYNFLKIQ